MDPTLNAFFGLSAERPNEPVAIGRGLHWTRAELARDVTFLGEALSRWLDRNGGGAGSIVALLVAPGSEFLATFLACRRAKACVLMMDARLTLDEQSRIAGGVGARCIWRPPADPEKRGLEGEIEHLPGCARLPEAACIKLSSGSTSEPAGIIVPPESLLSDGRALI